MHDGSDSAVPRAVKLPDTIPWPRALKECRGGGEHLRILVLLPTRGRPEKAVKVLAQAMHKARRAGDILWGVVVDEDDVSALRLPGLLKELPVGVTVFPAVHASKIEACNRMPTFFEGKWDILVSLSDDMWANLWGWDERVREVMYGEFPGRDGLLVFADGHQRGLCTLPIMGVNLWDLLGRKVYFPAYESVFADNELTDTACLLGLAVKSDEVLFNHEHPVWTGEEQDELYQKNDRFWGVDKDVYEMRKKAKFGVKGTVLSVLIPSLVWRRGMLDPLVEHLYSQAKRLGPGTIEILIDVDRGEMSIGEKRNRLLDRAKGSYICFIDDDDWVSDNYLVECVEAIVEHQPDVVTWWGTFAKDGVPSGTFLHSLVDRAIPGKRIGWHKFMHLNPVRRECIGGARFGHRSFAEDQVWVGLFSERVKTEAWIGGPHYHYRWRSDQSSCAAIGGESWAKPAS